MVVESLEECLIPGVLWTDKDAREVIYEVVRIGRRINRRNVINELIYRELGLLKTTESLPLYRNSKFLLKREVLSEDGEKIIISEEKDTLELFIEKYGAEKAESFRYINRILIPYAFGVGCIRAFNYGQHKLNETKKQRTGGEERKDAWYFVHSARTAGYLYEKGATPYQIRLSFLHDVIEDRRDWRIEQREKVDGEEKERLQREIENPPEYGEIRDLFVKRAKSWEQAIAEAEAELMVYQLRLVTRRLKESYEQYINRMNDGCANEDVLRLIRTITLDPEEQMNLYSAPPINKTGDSLDNTIRLPEEDMPGKKSRLSHNIVLLGGIYEFLKPERIERALGEYIAPPQILVDLSNKLITASLDEIKKIRAEFKDDSDLGIKADLEEISGFENEFEKFREMYNRYERETQLIRS